MLTHLPRTWHKPRHNIGMLFLAFYHRSKGSKVLDTTVGTTSQEHIIYLFADKAFAWGKSHIIKRFKERCPTRFGYIFKRWNGAVYWHCHTRIGSVGNHWIDILCVKCNFTVEHCIFIAFQGFPIRQCLVPRLAFRSKIGTFYIIERGFIWSNHTTTSTHFDRKIAKCQTAFHAHISHHFARIFHKITCCTACGKLHHHI